MTLALDTVPCPDSLLRRLDPRWKLAALVLAALSASALRTLPAAGLALAEAVVLVLIGRLPVRWYLTRLGALWLLLSPFVLTVPFLVHEELPLATFGPLELAHKGLTLALLIVAKATTIASLVLVLLAVLPLPTLLHAAHRLCVPASIVQIGLLSYRYIFLLAEELARVRIALRVRGFRNRATAHSYRTVAHVAASLLVRSHERAERVSQAMRCRGFDGRFRSLSNFGTTFADVSAFVVIVAAAGATLAWDLLSR